MTGSGGAGGVTLLLPRKIVQAILLAHTSEVTGNLTLHYRDGAVLAYTCETKERLSGVDKGDLIAATGCPRPAPANAHDRRRIRSVSDT